jgi:ATP-binding cassette subfamily B protein
MIAVVGEGVTNLLEPLPLKIVLDNVLKTKPLKGWFQTVILSIAGSDRFSVLKFAALAALVIAGVGAVCSYIEKYLTTSVGQWVMHDLRRTMYSHIQKLSLAYHDQKQTGDLMSRVTTDIDAVQSFVASGLLGGLMNTVTLVGMLAVMLYMNWRFTLIALSVAPVLFAVVFIFTRRIKEASRAVRKKEGEMVSIIQEVLSSMRVVKAFTREEYEQHRLEEQSLESVELALQARGLKAKLSPLVEILVACGTSLVLWYGARMVLAGALSAGDLIVFIWYMGKMYKPMQELSKMTDAFSKATIGYERIQEVLSTDGEIKDLPGARPARGLKGRIEFDKVNFSYEEGTPVLNNVSFATEPGQVVALVGPTGAGKTTIVSMIPRFYDPTSGTVKIDGIDVRQFQQRSLREHISYVLQETLLFHGPLWRNIAYGKPDATKSEIIRAATLANAHEFIEKLPEGYNTMVGERGVTLSGGERQRVAIARAIIRNSPILILDEASSGLDAASEKLVFEALDNLMHGKTSVVIAHRLSTIRSANIILVVKDGEIVERGTHDQLVHSGGLYSELYELQFQREEPSLTTP